MWPNRLQKHEMMVDDIVRILFLKHTLEHEMIFFAFVLCHICSSKINFAILFIIFYHAVHFAVKKLGLAIWNFWNFATVTVIVRLQLLFFTTFPSSCETTHSQAVHTILAKFFLNTYNYFLNVSARTVKN